MRIVASENRTALRELALPSPRNRQQRISADNNSFRGRCPLIIIPSGGGAPEVPKYASPLCFLTASTIITPKPTLSIQELHIVASILPRTVYVAAIGGTMVTHLENCSGLIMDLFQFLLAWILTTEELVPVARYTSHKKCVFSSLRQEADTIKYLLLNSNV
jgi:hypothetical protein